MSETYRINPLAWECQSGGDHIAQTPFGDLAVWPYQESGKFLWTAYEYQSRCGSNIARGCDSMEYAKRAAEQWYREKLLTALEKVT